MGILTAWFDWLPCHPHPDMIAQRHRRLAATDALLASPMEQ